MKTKKYLQELLQGAMVLLKLPGDWFLAQIEKRHTPSADRSYAVSIRLNNYANRVKGQDNLLNHPLQSTNSAEKELVINQIKKEVVIRRMNRSSTHMSNT